MSRAKLLFAACFALLVFGGVMTSMASAADEWQIEGETFTTGESRPLLPTALVLAVGKLVIKTGSPFEVVCKGEKLDVNSGNIVYPTEVTVASITFHECATVGSETCQLGAESESISTVPVRGVANLEAGGNVLILLTPKTKSIFATIQFSGASCALLGSQPVTEKGNGFHLLIDNGRTFKLLHLVLPVTLVGGLKVGSSEAELTGADWDIALNSHRLFRFL